MTGLRVFVARIAGLFTTRRKDADLDADIQAHLDLLTDEYVRNGRSPAEARAAARRDFGSVDQMQELHRDQRGFPFVEAIVQDVKYATRTLWRSPLFTIVAALSLAAAIGVNAVVFPLVDSLVFGTMPAQVQHPDRLIDIYTSAAGEIPYGTSSYPDYLDLRQRANTVVDIAAHSPALAAVRIGSQSRMVMGEIVSGNYFELLGVGAAIGRTLSPSDDVPGAPRVVMISNRFWQREFNADPGALGNTLRLHGQPYKIVGIAPPKFSGMTAILPAQLWTALAQEPDIQGIGIRDTTAGPGNSTLEKRGDRWLFLTGRLKDDVTVARAAAGLGVTMAQLATEYPGTNKERKAAVMPTEDVRINPAANRPLFVASGALLLLIGLILVIACANVTGMLLARSSKRQGEITIRLAIGASRRRLVQQLLTESLLLSGLGAIAGLGLAAMLLKSISGVQLPLAFPVSFEVGINSRIVLYTAGISILAGLLAGLAPALRATRPSVVGLPRWWQWSLRDWLVTAQMTTALVLLIVGALMLRGIGTYSHAEPGFQIAGVAAVGVPLDLIGYDNARAKQFFDQALDNIRALPGVEAAGLTSRPPLDINYDMAQVAVTDRGDDKGTSIQNVTVSPEYFSVLQIPIIQGRNFLPTDTSASPPVAIVTKAMADKYWPDRSAIGQHFRMLASDGPAIEVVGVCANYKVAGMGETPMPYIHRAASQQWSTGSWVILARSRGDAAALVGDIGRELTSIEPNAVLSSNRTMQTVVNGVIAPAQLAAETMAVVAGSAMLLAAVGLYGVIAYSVERRTREIGIRIALGASRFEVMRMVMRQGFVLASIGVLVGSLLSLGAAYGISSALSGDVRPIDPWAWGTAFSVFAITAILANLVPACRAARIQPTDALRRL